MPNTPSYRPVVRATRGNYSGAALVGTYSASIGWTFEDQGLRDGLLGFGVRRSDFHAETGELLRVDWLKGQKRFASDDTDIGVEVRSFEAPFQRFRWSDYSLRQERYYRYEIFPIRGTPGALTRDEPPLTFTLRPSPVQDNGLGVYVNRGVTAAFAYLNRFRLKHPKEVSDGSAYTWLSRGLKESVIDFVAAAAPGDALHVCIYEFHDRDIAKALHAARSRQIDVKIVYHAKADDHATEKNVDMISHSRLLSSSVPRRLTGNISHNKFIVHLKRGQPVRLLTGTANFSENAFHFQTNAIVVLDDAYVAQSFEDYFQILLSDPPRSRSRQDAAGVRNRVDQLMTRINDDQSKVFDTTFFSPLRSRDLIDAAADLIKSARSCVLVSAPFGLDAEIVEALGGNSDDIIEYGLANATARSRIAGLNRRNTRFFTPTRLKSYMGQAWDSKAFGAHKIHTKLIAVDPWSAEPKILFGSANFSNGSCKKNDENAFLSIGDHRLSGILVTEFLRMFDHYKSRYFIKRIFEGGGDIDPYLKTDGSWMNTSFRQDARSHKFRDRIVFSGY